MGTQTKGTLVNYEIGGKVENQDNPNQTFTLGQAIEDKETDYFVDDEDTSKIKEIKSKTEEQENDSETPSDNSDNPLDKFLIPEEDEENPNPEDEEGKTFSSEVEKWKYFSKKNEKNYKDTLDRNKILEEENETLKTSYGFTNEQVEELVSDATSKVKKETAVSLIKNVLEQQLGDNEKFKTIQKRVSYESFLNENNEINFEDMKAFSKGLGASEKNLSWGQERKIENADVSKGFTFADIQKQQI